MAQTPEIVFTIKDPFLVDNNIRAQIGLIDEDGFLTNITLEAGLTVTPITTASEFKFAQDSLILIPNAEGTVAYLLNFDGVEGVMSFFATSGIIIPTIPLLNNIIHNTLPPECYSKAEDSAVLAKIAGMSNVYNNLYVDLKTVFFNFFPPFTDNSLWGEMLNNYYSWQNSFDFGLVVQLFNNIPLANGNVFDTTRIISQYLFARFNIEAFVYIDESNFSPETQWILGESVLGSSTILISSETSVLEVIIYIQYPFLTVDQLNELNLFVAKILPASIKFDIVLETNLSVFGLLINSGDVYVLDPRLNVPFALKYDALAVYDVVALTSPFNPIYLTNFDYSPAGGTYNQATLPFPLTATATYTVDGDQYFQDVTEITTFTSSNETILTMTDNIVTIQGIVGSADVTATWEGNSVDHTFNVSSFPEWVMGFSELGANTILTN